MSLLTALAMLSYAVTFIGCRYAIGVYGHAQRLEPLEVGRLVTPA